MSRDEGFLRAIRDNPDDDGSRLVYADWLEEHGDERGEFIRLQCALATMPTDDPQRPELETRQKQLLGDQKFRWDRLRPEWVGPLSELVQGWEFHRGFVEDVSLPARTFLTQADVLFRLSTVRYVHLTQAGEHVRALAASPHLAQLTTLDLFDNLIGDAGVEALVASPHLTRLTKLSMGGCQIRERGVRALAGSRLLAQLTSLDLGSNYLQTAGVQSLLDSPYFIQLTELNLSGDVMNDVYDSSWFLLPNIGEDGVIFLASSPAVARLTTLDVAWNGVGARGFEALLTSPYLENLTSLHVYENNRYNYVISHNTALGNDVIQAFRARFGNRVSFVEDRYLIA